jgi:glycosyltransferase involved in cell wall biosynthesis
MILLISSVFPPEPVVSASIAYDLAVNLSIKTEVRVLSPKPSRPFGFSFDTNNIKKHPFTLITLNSFIYPKSRLFGRLYESYSFGKHAAKYIRKNHADITCIYLNVWPLLSQYFILKESKKYRIPSITHIQDIYPESLSGKLSLFTKIVISMLIPLDRWILKNSTKIITISNKIKEIIVQTRNINSNKINLIPNWQNEERFNSCFISPSEMIRNEPFTFMFLGNLNVTAAVDNIILAFQLCQIDNARLIIAGEGSEKNNLVILSKKTKDKNILFWDAPLEDVASIQNKADVLILSLKKQAAKYSLPSKLIAYMFSKKPIIACVEKESDTATVINLAKCGWIVPPEDISALSETMKTSVMNSYDSLQELGTNGFSYAIENFSKKINLPKLINIIESEVR